MNLTPPTTAVFIISLILAALAVIGKFAAIPFILLSVFITDPDSLVGADGGDMLMGDGSEDFLHGRSGDDYLIGGAGADLLYGGPGDDTLTDWQPTSLDATAPADADTADAATIANTRRPTEQPSIARRPSFAPAGKPRLAIETILRVPARSTTHAARSACMMISVWKSADRKSTPWDLRGKRGEIVQILPSTSRPIRGR